MADTTPKRGLPFPEITDPGPPDVAGDIELLATAVDTEFGSAEKASIATAQTRTNVAYGTLTTPDQVTGIAVPTDGVVWVSYRALWKNDAGAGQVTSAAIFVGSNQLKVVTLGAAPVIDDATLVTSTFYTTLYTANGGLVSGTAPAGLDTSLVTTGQIWPGAPILIDGLPAGTYTISVQFKTETGGVTATVKDRKLLVWTQTF